MLIFTMKATQGSLLDELIALENDQGAKQENHNRYDGAQQGNEPGLGHKVLG